MLFLALQQTEADDPQPDDLHSIGTVGVIRQMAKAPSGGVHVIVEGLSRARPATVHARRHVRLTATLTARPEDREQSIEVDAYVRRAAGADRPGAEPRVAASRRNCAASSWASTIRCGSPTSSAACST